MAVPGHYIDSIKIENSSSEKKSQIQVQMKRVLAMAGKKVGTSSLPETTIKLDKIIIAKQLLFQGFGTDQRHTTN